MPDHREASYATVESAVLRERYLVDVEGSTCTCPDFEERRGTCKHQHAVLFLNEQGS